MAAAHIQDMVGLSLDDITGRFELPFPNHLKIDVDGAEVSVISGAGQTLADPRLRTVMIEIYLDEERAAASIIMDAFSRASFVLENSSVIEAETGAAPNFIFTRRRP